MLFEGDKFSLIFLEHKYFLFEFLDNDLFLIVFDEERTVDEVFGRRGFPSSWRLIMLMQPCGLVGVHD
jgi:hypothetical protein